MKKYILIGVLLILGVQFSGSPKVDTYVHQKELSLRDKLFRDTSIQIPNDMDGGHLLLMYNQAVRLKIPIKIMFRVVKQESNFNPGAVSYKGARGYMQIMPGTWKYMLKKLDIPEDTEQTPEWNIIIGTEYLAYQYKYWSKRIDDEQLAWVYSLASYNAGRQRVIDYKGVPPFKETRNYVAQILY